MLTPKNWNDFQHYKDRRPLWIKLHHSLLDDVDFLCLPVASRALAPCLWLLASEYEGGEITLSFSKLAFRLRMTESDLTEALNPLVSEGFFFASDMLAKVEQSARLDREETETETEKKGKSLRSGRKGISEDIALATREILSFWPDPKHGDTQPNAKSRTLVPCPKPALLAGRLKEIKAQGNKLDICIEIAKRSVQEWKDGSWIQAPQYFFGQGTKEKPAAWKDYYEAHLYNLAQEVDLAS